MRFVLSEIFNLHSAYYFFKYKIELMMHAIRELVLYHITITFGGVLAGAGCTMMQLHALEFSNNKKYLKHFKHELLRTRPI